MADNRNTDYIPEEEYETGMVEETEGNDNPSEDCEDPFGAIQVVGDLEINDAREREENGFPVLEGDEYDEEEKTAMVSMNRPVLQTLDDFMEKVPQARKIFYKNSKHEIFNAGDEVRIRYFRDVLDQLESMIQQPGSSRSAIVHLTE